jgi:hypothetical protein
MNFAPVVLFTYKRLDHLIQTVESLQSNLYAELTDIYVYSDAAKSLEDQEDVYSVRTYLKTIDGFRSITIIERDYNWGLADNIIDGVTTIVNKYQKIIVLEDDLVSSKYFLQFMNEALERYQNEPRVMQISGYGHEINKDGLPDIFFSRLAYPWGWGTWDNRWQYFQRNSSKIIEEFTDKNIYDFTLEGTYNDFWRQILANHVLIMHTWWVFFYAAIFQRKGLVLYPKFSCIKNIGCDGTGVHSGIYDWFDVELASHFIQLSDVPIEENRLVLERYKMFYNRMIVKRMKESSFTMTKMRSKFEDFIRLNSHKHLKIVFFGTGSASKKVYTDFPFEIDYFVDNNQDKWGGDFQNKKIFNPQRLLEEDKNRLVIIIASQFEEQIIKQLQEMGFAEDIHIWNGYLMYLL